MEENTIKIPLIIRGGVSVMVIGAESEFVVLSSIPIRFCFIHFVRMLLEKT